MTARDTDIDYGTNKPCADCHGERGEWIEFARPGLGWYACTTCKGTGVEPKADD